MNRRLDGKQIQPADLTPDVYEGFSIVENIVLASSNLLREFLGLRDNDTSPGPIPKFVTRKNPSLDNYFADLILRACYLPVDYLPAYEEHVIRGSQEELPSDLNPRLVSAVLIGIGGMSSNPDFKKVYDEHKGHGTRTANSASDIVFQEHLECHIDNPGIQAIEPIRREIDEIDAIGGAAFDHIFTIVRNLHVAQFRQPGFISESLDAQWKRAIIEAVLMSVCVSISSFDNFSNQKAIDALEQEWNRYLKKSEKLTQNGFIDPTEPEAAVYVREMILRPNILEINGKQSNFTHRRILFALQQVWHPLVVSFIMGFLFEAMIQAQQSFFEMQKKQLPLRELPGNYALIYYQKEPLDKFPQRGILARMNDERKKAIVIVHDPARQITAIFRNNHLPKHQWKKFHDLLIQKEGDQIWYTPTNKEGNIANFILNGTESFVGVDMTQLNDDDFLKLFNSALKEVPKKD